MSRARRHTIERLHTLYPDFVLRMADKGLGTTVLHKPTWNHDVMLALTSAEFFEKIETKDSDELASQLTDAALVDFDYLITSRRRLFADHAKARLQMSKSDGLKNIGSLSAMPKLHKGIKEGGHVSVRCVVSHRRSIIGPVSRANAVLWRLARYKIELETDFEPRVMHDVADLIAVIIDMNVDIKLLCDMGVVDIRWLKIVTADMTKMYPNTPRSKIEKNIQVARRIITLFDNTYANDAAWGFMLDAIDFEIKYSYFKVAMDIVFRQKYGLIIGAVDGGDVTDTTYFIDEIVAQRIIEQLYLWKRYRDDVFILCWDKDGTLDEQSVINTLQKVYGTDMKYTVHICCVGEEAIPFLDAQCSVDAEMTAIRTSPYSKPGNARELTHKTSNVPPHVLKSIIMGSLRRYIIISDTKSAYRTEQGKLYDVLMRRGWSREDIRRTGKKPGYQDRWRIISKYLTEQQRRKREFLDRHDGQYMVHMLKTPEYSNEDIVSVKPPFNHVFDDLKVLRARIEEARLELPTFLKRKQHIIASRGVSKLKFQFCKNGL